MTRTHRLLAATAAVFTTVPLLWAATPAAAAPSNTKVSRVFELPCATPVCQSGEDSAASEGAVVNDSIQIHVTASSSLGLSSVELQARQVLNGDADSWVCMKHWGSSGSSFSDYYNWNSNRWPGDSGDPPSGCDASSFHGDLTRNATYDLRVIAADATGSTTSSAFSIKVSNQAEVPQWAGEPSVSGADEREPIVELRWKANPEPDVREYHFIREGPNGEDEYAVSATKPGGQGCELDGDTYICYDDDFSTNGFGGTYTYSLIALRASPSSRQACSLSPYGDCTESAVSDGQVTNIDEPEVQGPDAPPTSSGGNTGGSGGTGSGGNGGGSPPRVNRSGSTGSGLSSDGGCFTCGKFKRQLPYDSQQGFDLPGGEGQTVIAIGPDGEPIYVSDTSGRRRALRILAAGLVMLLIAAHLARLLRDPAPTI